MLTPEEFIWQCAFGMAEEDEAPTVEWSHRRDLVLDLGFDGRNGDRASRKKARVPAAGNLRANGSSMTRADCSHSSQAEL